MPSQERQQGNHGQAASGTDKPERSPSLSFAPLSSDVIGDLGGENARLCASLRPAIGDLTAAAFKRFAPEVALLTGEETFATGLDAARIVVGRRGVPDDRDAVFVRALAFSSTAFFAASELAVVPARRVAGAALFVSRWTKGLVAVTPAGLAATASPGLSFL